MTSIVWTEVFDYSNGKLFWKIKPSKKVCIGDLVGSPHPKGHLLVGFNRKKYYVHRIVYEMNFGPIPEGLQVDHINRITNDNRIENLRLATPSQNKWNTARQRNNISGFKSVFFAKHARKWRARIKVFGKVKHIGYFFTAEEAHAAYAEWSKQLHGSFSCS